jgi:hypothetical protein
MHVMCRMNEMFTSVLFILDLSASPHHMLDYTIPSIFVFKPAHTRCHFTACELSIRLARTSRIYYPT